MELAVFVWGVGCHCNGQQCDAVERAHIKRVESIFEEDAPCRVDGYVKAETIT